jgi:hypothetical protein
METLSIGFFAVTPGTVVLPRERREWTPPVSPPAPEVDAGSILPISKAYAWKFVLVMPDDTPFRVISMRLGLVLFLLREWVVSLR